MSIPTLLLPEFEGQDTGLMGLLVLQLPAIALLFSRLLVAPLRHPALQPQPSHPEQVGKVSVIVPTLNEVERLQPCLDGLSHQGAELREVIVVDSRSQDGTPELVKAQQQQDPRFRVMTDAPLPSDWVGRPWALHSGFLASSAESEWILGIDADTQPQPGLIASLLTIAQREQYDLISLAPRFILKTAGELWLQPALLITLVYRFGAAGDRGSNANRVMANGQCFLCRRSLLEQLNGYTSAKQSFCDDVTLARQAAAIGAKVGFLDGSQVLKVRMYEGMAETWTEWGRSLDLKDAASPAQIWGDLWFLTMVQAIPLPLFCLTSYFVLQGNTTPTAIATCAINGSLVAMRLLLGLAIAPSYDLSQAPLRWIFWFSAIADPLATLRIWLSSFQQPKRWRGRTYGVLH
ncbi:MAG: glycosyltransferase family 2 protein [Synechococcales bacterium]|nr:glycosyltransferase family 2 protein [Synechococcales bacterium]